MSETRFSFATRPFLGRAAYAALPLLAAFGLPPPAPPLLPGLAFALLAAYARLASLAARSSDGEKVLLHAELLPFLAFADAFFAGTSFPSSLVLTAEGAAAGALLLSLEALLPPRRGELVKAFAFIALAAVSGLGMALLPASAFLGMACSGLLVARFAAARRRS